MTNAFKNWVVAKIIPEINSLRPSHRQPVVRAIQVSEGFIGAIELLLPGYMEEYAKIYGRDTIKITLTRSSAEVIHQALRNSLTQDKS